MNIKIAIISILFAVCSLSTLANSHTQIKNTYRNAENRASRDVIKHVKLTPFEITLVNISQLIGLRESTLASIKITQSYNEKILSEQQVLSLLIQLSSYVGYVTINEIMAQLPNTIKKHSIELPKDTLKHRFSVGKQLYKQLDPKGYDIISATFSELAPQLIATTYPIFGDAFSQPKLSLKHKQLITVSCLTALGNAPLQLDFHVGTALSVGLLPDQLIDIAVLTQFYSGMPAAYNLALSVRKHTTHNKHENPYK
ncbi:carboxymuconolactone decarboxylase family protein [Pseudoalteromonas sp. MMG013]|uniref:carboxymuconolactone decarboxylase family protein n=1 Tax=Pseudoalteromonas sp. MMG013 TaxID=2822687 RepID=UPI001B398AC1|nr:carboxymuconolactone decarboxylase family protein [Pseudoalteromonas sp. MMG013]MBQ4864209.1 carboxymuconolactone decarboxylase family protein [Pseudoalteromonas sp. MMG013]